VVLLGCAGVVAVAGFVWLVEHTSPPPLPAVIVLLVGVVVLAVAPWAYLVARRLDGETSAGRIRRRVLQVAASLGGAGVLVATGIALGATGGERGDRAVGVAMLAIFAAGLLALVGAVVGPWLFLLTRMVTRERAARVRAEARAEVATHLHDSVLQTLALIQRRADDPGEVARLARHSERDLRAWLYPTAADGDRAGGLAAALLAVAAEVEDAFGVSVELVTVGGCPLDRRTRAVLGATREALVNAAKHAGVAQVSVFAEVADGELLVAVRDRGRGFDPATGVGPARRGIADSIVGRMRRHDGTATIRSTIGQGTEVELRMPLGGTP
jgi:signal transduction histidine kinase